jgi:hypothetical protein
VHDLFFRFGGGLPLHKVHFLTLRNPLDVPTTCSAIFPLKSSSDFFSILRHSCRLVPESFIPILPRSCCLRPRFLKPFLHSGPLKRLFSSVRPFRILGAMSFPCLCSPCSLPRATFVQWVVLIPAAANSLRGPQFSWGRISLKRFPFRHATLARRDTFLPAAVKLLLDSQLASIYPFGFWQRPAARFSSLPHFLSLPTGIAAASSWICLNLLCISLRRFVAGGRLLAALHVL